VTNISHGKPGARGSFPAARQTYSDYLPYNNNNEMPDLSFTIDVI